MSPPPPPPLELVIEVGFLAVEEASLILPEAQSPTVIIQNVLGELSL